MEGDFPNPLVPSYQALRQGVVLGGPARDWCFDRTARHLVKAFVSAFGEGAERVSFSGNADFAFDRGAGITGWLNLLGSFGEGFPRAARLLRLPPARRKAPRLHRRRGGARVVRPAHPRLPLRAAARAALRRLERDRPRAPRPRLPGRQRRDRGHPGGHRPRRRDPFPRHDEEPARRGGGAGRSRRHPAPAARLRAGPPRAGGGRRLRARCGAPLPRGRALPRRRALAYPAGESGAGQAATITADTGTFSFFDPDNLEVVVKVLDACPSPFARFWVFATALTDVATNLEVEDVVSGARRAYFTGPGQSFPPLQDTDAFATCD